jgi:hypothetical protein
MPPAPTRSGLATLSPKRERPKAGEREENGPTDPVPPGHSTGWGLAQGFVDSLRTRMARSDLHASPTGFDPACDTMILSPGAKCPRVAQGKKFTEWRG